MGIMSKIGLKLFSNIVAPIFALITARFIPAIGALLGGLSVAFHSFIALLIIFAIPIAIAMIIVVVAIVLGGGDTTATLASVLETVFGILILIPGLENILHQIWDWLEGNIQNWPGWPFENQTVITKKSVTL